VGVIAKMKVEVERIFAKKGLEVVEISKDDVKSKLEEGWGIGVELTIDGKFCSLFVDKDEVEFAPWGGIELKDYFEKSREKILKEVLGLNYDSSRSY